MRRWACIFLVLLVPAWAYAQDAKDIQKLEDLSKKMEEINRKIQACGEDPVCLQRVSKEAQTLVEGSGLATFPVPGQNVRTLTVTARNRVEYRQTELCNGARYVVQSYVFEYETVEKGVLRFSDDWSRFALQAPQYSNYGHDGPEKWKILEKRGYRQSVSGSRCKVEKYPDGAFKEIDSGNTKTGVVISYPHMPGAPNLQFHPIWISVANADHSCPSCSVSTYRPGIAQSANENAPLESITVTPEQMKKAVEAGRFQRTYSWTEPLDPGGDMGYSKNTVTITIEIEKSPGELTVSPKDGFTTHGDSKGKFTPPNKTYTLTNTGESSLQFTAAVAKPWLAVSTSGGTLAPGASTQVTVSLTAAAPLLTAGTYKDEIKFTNTTNGKGSTSRPATAEVGEYQIWDIKLTGKETDDMGGKEMYVKMNDVWQYVNVSYGVRFDYVMNVRVVLKKTKGKWKYESGTIVSGQVKATHQFDPTALSVKSTTCGNCSEVSKLAGQPIKGSVDSKATTLHLIWPHVVPHATVANKLKLKHNSIQESHKKLSYNYFESAEFFDRADAHALRLVHMDQQVEKVTKRSHKDRSRLDKRKPIAIYYRYFKTKIQ